MNPVQNLDRPILPTEEEVCRRIAENKDVCEELDRQVEYITQIARQFLQPNRPVPNVSVSNLTSKRVRGDVNRHEEIFYNLINSCSLIEYLVRFDDEIRNDLMRGESYLRILSKINEKAFGVRLQLCIELSEDEQLLLEIRNPS